MRSFPLGVLFSLLLAMCGLCAVQWWRESQLRDLALASREQMTAAVQERNDLNERLKVADAEMLRLTGALTELRTHSVPKADLDAALATQEMLKAKIQEQNQAITRQNEALKKQNEALQQQSAAIAKTNETIKDLAAGRDAMAARANEMTAKYNALIKKQGGADN